MNLRSVRMFLSNIKMVGKLAPLDREGRLYINYDWRGGLYLWSFLMF